MTSERFQTTDQCLNHKPAEQYLGLVSDGQLLTAQNESNLRHAKMTKGKNGRDEGHNSHQKLQL